MCRTSGAGGDSGPFPQLSRRAMDLRQIEAAPTDAECAAVDAVLGAPDSAWDGGARGSQRDAHTASFGGHETRARRHLLLPALQAVQARVGWISEGGLGYVCRRLDVPPAEAWGVATFYAMLATSPRPRRTLHVCDDIACRVKGALAVCEGLATSHGAPVTHAPAGHALRVDHGDACWTHAPCLGLCDVAPAALLTIAGEPSAERSLAHVTIDVARAALDLPRTALDDGPLRTDGAAAPYVGRAESEAAGGLRLLTRAGRVDPTSLAAYRAAGGYTALPKALAAGGDAVIAEVAASGLVGRGGAAFSTGRKWAAVRAQAVTPHYLICNADESEPGTFKDRVLLTEDPFAIVEAMTIAAWATKCEHGYVYLRAEYPLAAERVQHAIDMARAAGLLGERILGADFSFDIEIRRGAGAYICGEETAIFESIEGKRGEPRNKPPFPVSHGLFQKPTVVNNVETLANVLPIVLEGSVRFASVGTAQSPGTRLFCVSGHIAKPGVYELPMGARLSDLLRMAGGVTGGRGAGAVLLGGAAGAFVRADELDLALTHEDTRAAGLTLGSGVVLVFDDRTDLHDVVRRIAAFFRDESCGQCVPCRVGTVRQEEALHRIAHAQARGGVAGGVAGEVALLDDIGRAMKDGSICGLGQTAYAAVESAIHRLGLYGPATRREA